MKFRTLIASAALAVSFTGFAGLASAQDCSVTIDSTDQMKFDKNAVTIDSSCKEFTVNLTHSGQLPKNVMGHNWVLTEEGDVTGVAADGIKAGLENNYIKPNDERVLAATDIIGGGEKTSVTFAVDKLDADTGYVFFCSFPGHSAIMRGTVTLN